jgi:hypothetical protein
MKKTLSRGDEVYTEDVFQVLVDYEISRSKRYPSPVSLIHIEITPSAMDDEALRAAPAIFTTALNSHLRSVDIPSGSKRHYRVLLPTADAPGTHAVCERLLSVFRSRFDTKTGKSIVFTLNIGAASALSSADTSREILFEQAESALKHSKLKGQNTFVHFNDI